VCGFRYRTLALSQHRFHHRQKVDGAIDRVGSLHVCPYGPAPVGYKTKSFRRGSRPSFGIVVIGQASPLPAHRRRVLRALNLSLHRVEIAPYDVLATRANTVLDNVDRHLFAAEDAQTYEI
jgi:hypothetical protein